jgi:hypothetical protein
MASGFTAAQTGRTHDRTQKMLQQLRKFLPRRRLICQRRWQAQLLIETGATEPFEIVLSLAVVFDGHLLRDTRCPFMTVSVAIDLACDNSGDHSR